MTFTLLGSSAELANLPNLTEAVKSVFSQFNWSGCNASTQLAPNQPLNLKMSVQQFFSGFAWESGAIATPTQPELPPLDHNLARRDRTAFTLDDFSDLF